ncbi:MAG: DUF2971 domain-containing protein [Clostridia bacterium]|nr:DUF2971 domain-containing protein [Clostridia bacterium]
MNDPSELVMQKINWANLILSIYNENRFDFLCITNGFKSDMKHYLELNVSNYNLTANGKYNEIFYALCFSENADDLNQWRLYADDCKGVCLGFDRKAISSFCSNKNYLNLINVEYYDDIRVKAREIAIKYLEKLKKLSDNKNYVELNNLIFTFMSDMEKEFAKYKLSAYKSENEVRLIYKQRFNQFIVNNSPSDIDKENLNKIFFHKKYNRLSLGQEFELSDLGLSSITLGPLNETSLRNIILLLSKYGISINQNNIFKSQIPYRGLS